MERIASISRGKGSRRAIATSRPTASHDLDVDRHAARNPILGAGPGLPPAQMKHQFQFAGYYAALEEGFYRACLLSAPPVRRSSIGEIAQLQSAAALLRNSLQSFSSFVPLDVVRQLIQSGIPLALGVESRFLTVLFSELENFAAHAEQWAPDELLGQMSTYFEEVSRAISEEHGTVDKFIGDGVMAFWGAPARQSDHVLRACAGVLRAARRMERVNEARRAEGRPSIRIRIGLNCANVLVGNVGSSERLSYTVMGDGVNVAARLEGINLTRYSARPSASATACSKPSGPKQTTSLRNRCSTTFRPTPSWQPRQMRDRVAGEPLRTSVRESLIP